MKFYDYKGLYEANYDAFRKYIVNTSDNESVFKLEFDECQKEEFFRDMHIDSYMDLGLPAVYIGEDGYLYSFFKDGTIKKGEKCSSKLEKQLWRGRIKLSKKIRRDKKYWDKVISKINGKQIESISESFGGYNKYIYINSEKNYVIPFRLKESRRKNAPLLIYYQGAGALGHDNFKPLFEFKSFLFGKKIPDCNILIPQAPYSSNFGANTIEDYVANCIGLINTVSENSKIDLNRIYCFGTSFGGGCVWQSLYDYPDMFAAAVPVMGMLMDCKNKLPQLVRNYKNTPLWIAHSSDDNNVKIDSDDIVYNELKKINPSIKYTRWNKYGHNMAKYFYRREPFIAWMFSQTK